MDSKIIVFEMQRKVYLCPCLGRSLHFDLAYLLNSTLKCDQIFMDVTRMLLGTCIQNLLSFRVVLDVEIITLVKESDPT